MSITHTLLVALIAVGTERLLGYPRFIYNRIGHPTEWLGGILTRLESALNRPDGPKQLQRVKGAVALLVLIAAALAITVPIAYYLRLVPYGAGWEALLAAPLIAQSELRRFVRRVADGLEENLQKGRDAVRHIVGRDPAQLSEAGVARGAIESLAENTSDGIVAPVFWLALFGLPGVAVYKAINTADSMIGYKSPRYLHFGWASARLDDLVNLIASRLTAVLFAGAAALTNPSNGAAALEAVWRDARKHVSPNAGWPEAAVAGALDIRLGGPRSYDGRVVELPWMGNGTPDLTARDIRRALRLYVQAITLMAVLLFFCWMFV